jgi:hypothetical protein
MNYLAALLNTNKRFLFAGTLLYFVFVLTVIANTASVNGIQQTGRVKKVVAPDLYDRLVAYLFRVQEEKEQETAYEISLLFYLEDKETQIRVYRDSEGIKIAEWTVVGEGIWQVANDLYNKTDKVDFAEVEHRVKIRKRLFTASPGWWQRQYRLCFSKLSSTMTSFNASVAEVDKTGNNNLLLDPMIYKFRYSHLGEEVNLTLMDFEGSTERPEIYPLTKWMNSFRKAVSLMK